ncbi:glycosyltransferase family 4 protein [Rhizobium tropici]|nr:glycosyltransferase family 1 protein [Rhizobium tropici]
MGKIWFDVTSILLWNRPAVGVIRVETECAKYALEHNGSSVGFCRYDHGVGYVPVSADEVRRTIDRINQTVKPQHANAVNSQIQQVQPIGTPLIVRVAVITRRVLNRLPRRIGDATFSYLSRRRGAAYAAINGLREFRTALRAWHNPMPVAGLPGAATQPSKKALVFERDDVYISLGLDWDQKSTVYIAEKKAQEKFKAIFCCYDVIPVKLPHLCVGDVAAKFARYFSDLAWCADEFVSISECSKRDLIELLDELGAPTPETTVITLGSHLPASNGDQVSEETKRAAGDRYILFVSTIERRKNHETLYRAYTRLVDQGVKNLPKLVFVGMPGWGVADFLADLRFDPRMKDKVQLLTNISDPDLAWLYREAMFTVFPSLYEGWGLAVAESLAAGKFCLASNAASIPEVGGDLIEYLDPWDVPRWAERLKWYFDNPESLARAENRIRKEYSAPKWEDTAKVVFGRAEALLAQ